MIVNKIISDGKLILAICDDEMLGKVIQESGLVLDLSSDFYQGVDMDMTSILELIKKAYIINAVGKKSVKMCIDTGVIDKQKVLKIKGVPYAQMVRF